jgi:hypothetical protein
LKPERKGEWSEEGRQVDISAYIGWKRGGAVKNGFSWEEHRAALSHTGKVFPHHSNVSNRVRGGISLLNLDMPVKDVRVVHDAGHGDGGPAQKVVLRPVVEIKHLNTQNLM